MGGFISNAAETIGDTVGDITSPILGKADPETMESSYESQTGLTNTLANITKDYYTQTGDVRTSVIDKLTQFMEGNYDPTASAMYAPIKNYAEDTYATSKNSLMELLPQGGALYDSLGDLEGKKADTLSTMLGQLVSDEYTKAYNLATGSQTSSTSGYGSALSGATSLMSALTGSNANISSNAISGLSSILAAIYGK